MSKSSSRTGRVLGVAAAALLGTAATAGAVPPTVYDVGVHPTSPRTSTEALFSVFGAESSPTFAWDFSGGSTFTDAAGVFAPHTFSADGIHPVAWRVSNAEGESTSGRFIIATHPDNWAPRVAASDDPDAVTGRPTYVSAYAVDDSPESGWTYAFELDGDNDFDDGEPVPSGDSVDPSSRLHTFASDGAHQVKVRVTDGQGQTTEDTATITTHTENRAPVVQFAPEYVGRVDEPVTLYSNSYDDYTHYGDLVHEWYVDGVKVEGAGEFYVNLPAFAEVGEHAIKLVVSEPGEGGLKTEMNSVLKIVEEIHAGESVLYVFKDGDFDHNAAPTFATLENARVGVFVPGAPDAATYAWDLDADGAYDDATHYSTFFSALNKGTYKVAVQVSVPGQAPTRFERTVVVDSGPDYAKGADPVVVPPTITDPNPGPVSPPVQKPVGKAIATLGPVLLSDGNVPGSKPGVTGQGINLKARSLFFGSLFSSTPAQVTAQYTVALTKAGKVKASAAAKKKKKKAKVLKLGRSVVSLPGNASAPLKVKLSSKAKKALAKAKKVKVTAKFNVKDLLTGKSTTATRTIKLKVVKK